MLCRRSILIAGSGTLLVLVLLQPYCHASSSCGDVQNIGFPFRLEGDGKDNCRDDNFILSCENNRTISSLFSGKYLVQSINYSTYTIRLADVGVEKNDCSSLPIHYVVTSYTTYGPWYSLLSSFTLTDVTSVVLLSCEIPVKSPHYIDIPGSCDRSSSSSKRERFSYALVGDAMAGDIEDSCTVDTVVFSSAFGLAHDGEGNLKGNLSYPDIHNGFAYGFDVYWELGCKHCRRRALCLGYARDVHTLCPTHCLNDDIFLLESPVVRMIVESLVLIGHLIALIISARCLCTPCVFGFLIYKFKRRHLSTFDSIEGFLRSQNNLVPIRYSYSQIRKMTKGFQDKLGEGGYGSVYKGRLRSGNLVAVKILSKAKADGQEFINEVSTIGRIHHVNVVQLIGYCAERSKRALVYDFMPNGSLEKYIFSREEKSFLSCDQVFEIALGVARGIEYLHRGCDMQILHFDIKPHNILLDKDFTPKVSDFGLAKLYPTEDSIVPLTAIRGTMGYMAPELFYKNIGGVSYKADVYSFGMLLMEMAGRRRNWSSLVDHSSQTFFLSWVYEQFNVGRLVEIGDTTEKEGEIVRKMLLVALWCIQMKPNNRPSMNRVVEMLEGNIELLQIPPRPFLYPDDMPADNRIARNLVEWANLSGACMDCITMDLSGR